MYVVLITSVYAQKNVFHSVQQRNPMSFSLHSIEQFRGSRTHGHAQTYDFLNIQHQPARRPYRRTCTHGPKHRPMLSKFNLMSSFLAQKNEYDSDSDSLPSFLPSFLTLKDKFQKHRTHNPRNNQMGKTYTDAMVKIFYLVRAFQTYLEVVPQSKGCVSQKCTGQHVPPYLSPRW